MGGGCHTGRLGGSFEDLAPAQVELAKRIIAEIEAKEGKPAQEIPEVTVGKYVNLVADRLQQLSRKNFRIDAGSGKSLLNQLRLIK